MRSPLHEYRRLAGLTERDATDPLHTHPEVVKLAEELGKLRTRPVEIVVKLPLMLEVIPEWLSTAWRASAPKLYWDDIQPVIKRELKQPVAAMQQELRELEQRAGKIGAALGVEREAVVLAVTELAGLT